MTARDDPVKLGPAVRLSVACSYATGHHRYAQRPTMLRYFCLAGVLTSAVAQSPMRKVRAAPPGPSDLSPLLHTSRLAPTD